MHPEGSNNAQDVVLGGVELPTRSRHRRGPSSGSLGQLSRQTQIAFQQASDSRRLPKGPPSLDALREKFPSLVARLSTPETRKAFDEAAVVLESGDTSLPKSPEVERRWLAASQALERLTQTAELPHVNGQETLASKPLPPRSSRTGSAEIQIDSSGNGFETRGTASSQYTDSTSLPVHRSSHLGQHENLGDGFFDSAGLHPSLDPRTFYEPVEPSQWRPPEGDSCLELYRRAYCSYGDALLPPLYFTLVGLTCYYHMLPIWAILLLLLPLFGLGMHCLVFKGSGHTAQTVPRSRLLLSFVLCVELWSLGVLLLELAPNLHGRHSMQIAVLTCICLLGLALHIRCVDEFDHHCPVVANCVGRQNHRTFLLFICCTLADQMLFCWLALQYFLQLPSVRSLRFDGPLGHRFVTRVESFWWTFQLRPGIMLLVLIEIPLLIGNVFLIMRQLICIAANLTTNEFLTHQRYSYLRQADGRYQNVFDRGCSANCWQFWCQPRPDWVAEYQERSKNMADKESTAASIIAAYNSWKERRVKRRQERREALGLNRQNSGQRLPAGLIADIS